MAFLASHRKTYKHRRTFWSDLGPEHDYKGIGLKNASLPTVAVVALSANSLSRSGNLMDEEREITQSIDPNKPLPEVECCGVRRMPIISDVS